MDERSAPGTLRVLTWNLHGAGRPDLDAVVRLLRGQDADVVALQEVRRGQAERLAAALGAVGAAWTLKHRRYGPLLRRHSEGHALLLPEDAEVASHVLTPGRSLWTSRRRVAQVADLPHAGVRVINTHLDAHDPVLRAPQARLLAGLVRSGSRPCVLLGDLNARSDEAGVFGPLRAAGLRDAWPADAGARPAAFTSPAHAPAQRIDHVLVSGSIEVRRVEVPADDWARWSDHLPVVADLVLRPDERAADG